MSIFKSLWQFFALHQTKTVRMLHLLILIGVVAQILISGGMRVTPAGVIPPEGSVFYFTWLHIFLGIALLFLSIILIIVCLKNRGLRYFFPYLWGDITQIKQDLKALITFKLPDSSPKGLATSVQGLGLGALFLAVVSGAAWFVFWSQGSPLAHDVENIHKMLVGLIEIYFVGHGGMALLHFFLWRKTSHNA